MYCRKCGAEINNRANFCPKCGNIATNKKQVKVISKQIPKKEVVPKNNRNKTTIGVIMAIFFGFVGLIIGIVLYPKGSIARQSFVDAWLFNFIFGFLIRLILVILFIFVFI